MCEPNGSLESLIQRYLDFSMANPDRPAYVENFSGRRFAMSDFVSLAADIQSKLISRGIRKNDIVAVKLGRTAEHMAARLAIIAMGAVCLPIEPNIPSGRYRAMTKNMDVKAVIDDVFFPVKKSSGKMIVEKMDDDEPCFIIFTSGSTGVPKGILHSRKTPLHLARYMREFRIEWPKEMVFGQISNISFIVSWAEFVFHLDRYSVNHLFDDRTRGDINAIRKQINGSGISTIICNPNYYRALGPDTCIELAVLAGERTDPFEESGRTIIDCYGSSEVICGYRVLNKEDELRSLVPVPEGRFSTEDENGNEVEEGELVYRGPGIMTGYLGDELGKGPLDIYRTGDIARRTADGYVIIGRKDSMIKIRGQRVEPAETEFVMSQIPGMSDAAVKAFSDCGNYLCAYYVSEDVDEKKVRDILSSKLNSYQIPKFIRRMESLPRNANGKIDRPALQSLRATEGCTEAPSGELETIVCNAFGNALGIKNVGLDDDFVEFGGDSLGVMKVIASFDAMKKDSSMVLRPSDVMLYRTPRAISENIRRVSDFECRYNLTTGAPIPDSVRAGYILVKKYDEKCFAIPVRISMGSWKDYSDAEDTIKKLVYLFPALSMRIEQRNGTLWMVYDRMPDIIRKEEDPNTLDVLKISEFDPDKDVATRFFVCKHEGKISVVVSMSHLVFDGRSAAPLMKAMMGGRTTPDLGLIRQGAYDESMKGTAAFERSKEIFEKYMRPTYSDAIPELPKYDIESDGIIYAPMDVPASKVKDFAKECGVSVTSLVTIAFGIAKANFVNAKESMFSLVTGGRTGPDTNDSVGMFTKIIPVHISKKDMEMKDYIRHCSSELSELIAHDEYPVSELLPDMYPDFGFIFQYSDFVAGGTIPGVEAELLKGVKWFNNSSMSVLPNGDTLFIKLKYSVRYREEDIAELLCDFDEMLEKMMSAERSSELFKN